MRTGTCKYFNGITPRNELCGGGLNIRAVTGGDGFGWARRMPCMKNNEGDITCELYTEPTNEEIEKEESEMKEAMDRMLKAMPFISELKQEFDGVGGSGTHPCPVCNNTLHFTVSACNNHVHGCCETDDCLKWME